MIDVVVALVVAIQNPALGGDSARCDSILAHARVDSVPAALFLSAAQVDGPIIDPGRLTKIRDEVHAAFIPPRPFRLSVFAGPPLSRSLRITRADTEPVLRAPTVTGVYRFGAGEVALANVTVVRASRVDGFDSAAVQAIHAASVGDSSFVTPPGGGSLHVDIAFSTDSLAGAERLVSAYFPRMPVVDAAPVRDNPPLEYPANVPFDRTSGEVVLRFVVDRDSVPDLGTVQVVRTSDYVFTRAALVALVKHRFRPASIRGCSVAQQIDYAMTFLPP